MPCFAAKSSLSEGQKVLPQACGALLLAWLIFGGSVSLGGRFGHVFLQASASKGLQEKLGVLGIGHNWKR